MMRTRLLALLTVVAMIAAACGDDEGTSTTEAAETTSTQATEDDATQSGDDSTSTTAETTSTEAPDSDAAQGDQLTVVVTTTIWGDVVSNLVEDDATVEVLFPIGADPHDYQLSAAQTAAMQEADLVVVNGLALEEGALDVIEGLEADGANVLEVAGLLNPIEFGEGGHGHGHEGEDGHEDEDGHDHEEGHDHEGDEGHEDEDSHDHEGEEGHEDEDSHDHEGEDGHEDEDSHGDEEGHDHAHDGDDPHVWMDPLRVADAVELIAEELTNLDASVDWDARAMAYADGLRALDAEIVALLQGVPEERRKLVTNHDAFGYFAERYGFEVVGTVIPSGSTLADPSSAELAELIEILVDENINVIFAETIEPAALADAVAAEVEGVTVVELFTGSLGEAGSGAETYIDFIRTNATRIADALS